MTTQTVTIERSKLEAVLDVLEECRRDPRLKYEHPAYDKAITAIKEALAVDKESLTTEAQQSNEQGCEHCNHSLYCGTKCKNCGKQSNEQVEPVAWVQDVEFEQSPEFAFSWVETRLHNVPLYTHPPVPTAQPEQDKERCVGCDACIDTACGRDECPKGWPKASQPEQESVVIQYASKAERDLYEMEDEDDTTTLQRKPLTKSQVLDLWEQTYVQRGSTGIEFARAIEAAHGIKE